MDGMILHPCIPFYPLLSPFIPFTSDSRLKNQENDDSIQVIIYHDDRQVPLSNCPIPLAR